MTNTLSLELDKTREISLGEQAGNILNNISDAFSNAIKKGAEKIDFPDNLGEKVKEGLEKINETLPNDAKYQNVRNAASGILKNKIPNREFIKYLRFMPYNIYINETLDS